MNRYALAGTIVVAVLVALAIVGSILLHLFRPDASATFIQNMVTLIGLATTAAGVFYGFSKQGDRLGKIEENTNGRLSSRDRRIAELERMALDAGIDPQTGQAVTGSTATTTPKEPAGWMQAMAQKYEGTSDATTAQPDPQQPG